MEVALTAAPQEYTRPWSVGSTNHVGGTPALSSEYDIGREHERLCERVAELEAGTAERVVADALLLERITVLESKSHHHSEPEPDPEPDPEEQEEAEEEAEEAEEQEEPEPEPEPEQEPVAEVPPERKHLLHRLVWSR